MPGHQSMTHNGPIISACCANTVFAHYCTPHDKPNIHTVLPVTEYTTGKNTHIILPTLPL